jgi:signal transduction histidine kinase
MRSTIAVAVLVSAALFCALPLGYADFIRNSHAGTLLVLCVPFLICYALGYQNGLVAGLAGVGLMLGGLLVSNGSFSPIPLMITLGPWAGGQLVRSRRRLAEQLKARNDQLLAQQEAYAAEAVRYERSRIAADLHDIVGHALSLMVIQASAAQRVSRSDESRARTALEIVTEAAHQAQADVGLLAGMLADEQAGVGLDLTAELVRQVRAAGVDVTYRLVSDSDSADMVSAEVVCRIVTEALTNALKHAPGAPVTVDIHAAEGGVTVTVENGAAARAGLSLASGGYGLTGMRDRVLSVGGQFDAGPTEDGGWRVRAVLPLNR